MGEFLSQAPVTLVRTDLRTLKYGGPPAEIAPSGMSVYELVVWRILGKSTSQFALQLGQNTYPIRGQGDRLHFASGMDRGAFIRLPRWQNVNPGGTGVGIVELMLVHEPDVSLLVPQTDPLAAARLVSMPASATAAAGTIPEFDLINPFDPAVPIGLFNVPCYGHCRRLYVTLSIDGNVSIGPQALAAPVAGANFPGAEHVAIDTATMGPPVFKTKASTPAGGGTALYTVGCRAGQVTPIDVVTDIWPSVTGAQNNALSVYGPVGPCTMVVTAEWQEIELQ